MKSENLYWIWLSERLGAGSRYLLSLVDKFESPFEIYRASEEEIVRAQCVNEDVAHTLADKNLENAYKIIDYCTLNNIGILSYSDENYPSKLRNLKDPPCVLYYKGTWPDVENRLCIAMVGTRKMSEYGKRAGYKLAYELACAGVIIVSGMALGVDSVCASGAISAGGKTVAVLGCGIDITYPSQHARLRKIIEDNGVVITEFAPGTRPMGINFPLRNRIISGLSNGTLIVEADEKSGALITAKCALMQGREVYAVPGNIDESNSSGTNQLIHDGAYPVIAADDLLTNYSLTYANSINYSGLAYGKASYKYDEENLMRMGVSARVQESFDYRNSHSRTESGEKLKSSELRPMRKPSEKADERKLSTNDVSDNKNEIKHSKRESDKSEEILESLDETSRNVFMEIPIDRSISIDKLCSLGFTVAEVMASLTVLEVNGLISTLPGNIYIRR